MRNTENQHVRYYVKVPGSKRLVTICEKTGLKVGSAECTKRCVYFAGVDHEQNRVTCTER